MYFNQKLIWQKDITEEEIKLFQNFLALHHIKLDASLFLDCNNFWCYKFQFGGSNAFGAIPLIMFPVEYISNYADKMAKMRINNNEFLFRTSIFAAAEMKLIMPNNEDGLYAVWDETVLGELAYVAIKGFDEEVRNKGLAMLNKYFQYYNKYILKNV